MTPEIPIEAFEIFAAGLNHPKGLAFDRRGELWCGSETGMIYRISPEKKITPVTSLGSYCAGLAFSPIDDALFVCHPASGIVRVDANGEYTLFAAKAGEHKLVCPNFGLFDAQGNYYVTDSGFWKKNNGHLLRFRPDGKGEVLAGPFGFVNGLALSADEKFLFMVESNTDRVLRFEIRADGTISAPEVYAEECGRFPDGLTLDAEGNLYVSCYASDEIWKISSARGKTLMAWDHWAIQLGSPTGMVFGGADMDELFIANLSRWHIARVKIGRKGQLLANQRVKTTLKRRPMAL